MENGFVSSAATGDWERALITGNGRQGALVYGEPDDLRLTLSHERLFLPVEEPLPPPHTARVLPELRDLLYGGRYREAAERVADLAAGEHSGYADTRWIDPLVPAATLHLSAGEPGACRRTCDFTTGLVTQEWGAVRQEVFVSRPDDVVVIRLSGAGGLLRLAPIEEEPPVPIRFIPLVGPGRLVLHAAFPARRSGAIEGYTVECRVVGPTEPVPGGLMVGGDVLVLARTIVRGNGSRTVVSGSRSRTVVSGDEFRTVMRGGESGAVVHEGAPSRLDEIPADFDVLLARHAAVHGELFARSSVRLTRRIEVAEADGFSERADGSLERTEGDGSPEGADGSSERVEVGGSPEWVKGSPEGAELVERLFEAGRYAVISSSGELPPTLQGVWGGTYDPPWRSGYTLDGNLASAVAALQSTGTPELMLPVFDLVDGVMEDFRENARRLYGCRGILVPAHMSSHGLHNHFGRVWCLTFWTAGAGWLARLYYDHYAYTGDLAFLRDRAWPFMVEAAEFYEDFLAEGGDFAPSYSPENTPAGGDSQACVNATMDVAVARDLFRNLLRTCELLGLDGSRWQRLLDGLPGYRIAPTGELAEWAAPAREPVVREALSEERAAGDLLPGKRIRQEVLPDNHAHRHASHLYPLWYERDPAFDDPGLERAAILAVRRRLDWWQGSSSDEMAFGLVQLGLAAAALGQAEDAHRALTLLATRYWRENLVSTHNRDAIFNVDVCGGLPALVAAMLVRSGEGRLDLLPALPGAWERGEARGLVVRGATVERLTWEPGRVEAVISARIPFLVACGAERERVSSGRSTPLTFVRLDAKLIQQPEA